MTRRREHDGWPPTPTTPTSTPDLESLHPSRRRLTAASFDAPQLGWMAKRSRRPRAATFAGTGPRRMLRPSRQPSPASLPEPTLRRTTRQPPDQGAATIWAATAAALLAAYALALLAIGTAVLARHRAGVAADLGALAAAAHADADGGGSGADRPCAWAERAVQHHGAVLVACGCADAICAVTAAEPTPWGTAAVSSRAGPADDPSVDPAQPLDRGEPTNPAEFAGSSHSADSDRLHVPGQPLTRGWPAHSSQPLTRGRPAPPRRPIDR